MPTPASRGLPLIQPFADLGEGPDQECMHVFDRMVSDAFEDLAQIIRWVMRVLNDDKSPAAAGDAIEEGRRPTLLFVANRRFSRRR